MKILVLTSIYPQLDDEKNIGVTPVVQYFSEEWVKQGHEVLVVHNSSRYPKILYLLPDSVLKKINSKLGIVIPNYSQSKELNSTINGVKCFRLPLLKIIPKKMFSERQIQKQLIKIEKLLDNERFKPDLILGHWENPQIQLISKLKEIFNARTGLVFHALVYINQRRYTDLITNMIKNIDVLGARSNAIACEVKKLSQNAVEPFICYSGISDRYFHDVDDFFDLIGKKVKNSYIYVGRLIKRKNIDSLIMALGSVYENNRFSLNVVGDGAEKYNLQMICEKNELSDRISFLGYKKRNDVIGLLCKSEIFVMISDNETFGLVYIEAMSQGCIVIASKNGGMDGIIVHGFNGFLCEQGNKNELASIITMIRNMSSHEKNEIVLNALKTSRKFSDSNVAKKYLENVLR
ncbi:glycosyltransferase family 4 protein [Dethiosulfatibacter aminovorans]|nr:glycosyltransferase family 4 protein [Dethiosulfatibacter aminovorans]